MKEISKEVQELVLKKIEELAEYGDYDCAKYLGEWEGYDVFTPSFLDTETEHIIGFPEYLLVKDNKLTVVQYNFDERYMTLLKYFE